MGTNKERLESNKRKIQIVVGILILIIFLSLSTYYLLDLKSTENGNNQEPIFKDKEIQIENISLIISFEKDTYSQNEWISFSANLTNLGDDTILLEGYCVSFLITYPNDIERELFFFGNASVGNLEKDESHFFQNNLESYSYKTNDGIKSWKEDKQAGEYHIWGVYNSPNNPFFDPSDQSWYMGVDDNAYGINFTQEFIIKISD